MLALSPSRGNLSSTAVGACCSAPTDAHTHSACLRVFVYFFFMFAAKATISTPLRLVVAMHLPVVAHRSRRGCLLSRACNDLLLRPPTPTLVLATFPDARHPLPPHYPPTLSPLRWCCASFCFVLFFLFCAMDVNLNHQRSPSVDYTSAEYITLLFTDLGVLTPSAVSDELIRLYGEA